MSPESVEIVRQAIEAAWRQPKPDFEVVNALYDPEHEFVARLSAVEGRTFRGAAGFREWMTLMDDIWEQFDMTLEPAEDLGEGRVLVCAAIVGRSRLRGVPLEQRVAFLATVRDRRIVRTETFGSPEEARTAASRP